MREVQTRSSAVMVIAAFIERREQVILFYQEANGDYLAVETSTNGYYCKTFGWDNFEGRATAISGLVGSVCTTGVSRVSSPAMQTGAQEPGAGRMAESDWVLRGTNSTVAPTSTGTNQWVALK